MQLYTPLLYSWARNACGASQDADDLVQDVLTHLVRKMPEFEYDRQRSFRNWLKTVTLNVWRNRQRRRQVTVVGGSEAHLSDLPTEDLTKAFEESEYRSHLLSRALGLMQAEFHSTTWKACWEHVVSGRTAAEVAAELGISEGAVYVAKFRVLRRLRQELQGLLD